MQLQTIVSFLLASGLVSALPAAEGHDTHAAALGPRSAEITLPTRIAVKANKREPDPTKPTLVWYYGTPWCSDPRCAEKRGIVSSDLASRVAVEAEKREPDPAKPTLVWYYGTPWKSCHGDPCTIPGRK